MKGPQHTISIALLIALSLTTITLPPPHAAAKWEFFSTPGKVLQVVLGNAFPWTRKSKSQEEEIDFGPGVQKKLSYFLKGRLKLLNQNPARWQYIRGLTVEKMPEIDVSYALETVGLSQRGKDAAFDVRVKKYGKEEELGVAVTMDTKTQTIILPFERSFEPGLYTATIESLNPQTGRTYSFTQDFAWGVLAMNADKDRYYPGEDAQIAFGVLNELGMIVCDATLSLMVTDPLGNIQTLSTTNGRIQTTGTCGSKEPGLITPDYKAFLELLHEGEYALELTAETDNGIWIISSPLTVTNTPSMIVERKAATRLWPFAPSPVTIKITFTKNYTGSIREELPSSFIVTDTKPAPSVYTYGDTQYLSWSGSWKAGDTVRLYYEYDAPDISPEFYLLGPITTKNDTELRSWQIANDDPPETGFGYNTFYFLGE